MQLSPSSQIRFYICLLYYKLLAPFETENYQIKILKNEFSFIFHALNSFKNLTSQYASRLQINTKFGIYKIRDMSIDLTIASPSFERQDVDEMLYQIHESLKTDTNIVFVEIGAGFGKYTIAVGKSTKNYASQIKIFSFEPEPESYELLKENIQINRLKNAKAFKTALSTKKSSIKFYYYEPMKMIVSFPTNKTISIKTEPLDHFNSIMKITKETVLFMTLDVEGHEIEVLQGMQKIIKKAKKTIVMIEDSGINNENKLSSYLSRHGKFILKKTMYNSFWQLNA